MKTLWGITTYQKNDIAEGLIDSLREHKYLEGNQLVLADDAPGDALNLLTKHKEIDAYLTGNLHGIGKNKNRIIKYFFEKSDAERLVLCDNDFIMTAPGILQEFEEARVEGEKYGIIHDHINGYVIDADGNDGLAKTFPTKQESKYLRCAEGCHGIMLWFTRDLLKKVGYIYRTPYYYGYDHSDISSRAMMVQGYTPNVYPSLKRSTKFFKLNPNDRHVYDVDLEKVYGENAPVFHERFERTCRGVDLKEWNHHLDKELTITRDKLMTPDAIIEALKPSKKLAKRR